MRAVFVDANVALRALAERLGRETLPELEIEFGSADITADELPDALAGAPIMVIDHTALPIEVARRCSGLAHVVFLGTGARSYMDPEALAGIGIAVHIIKGYGDTAVAECAIGLLFAAARGFAIFLASALAVTIRARAGRQRKGHASVRLGNRGERVTRAPRRQAGSGLSAYVLVCAG